MVDFENHLRACTQAVERSLAELLSDNHLEFEIERPARLMQAVRHSSLNGGKRLRPFLLMETASLFGLSAEKSIMAGTALECIHCYSLVHDDLPAMDDDDLRRGKPTTHIKFDEATAILAGDALLTLAFDILSRSETHPDAATRIELVKLYARSAGIGGMVGGQMFDLQAEEKPSSTEAEILKLQAMKTGALIRCACEAGAVLAGASPEDRARMAEFGKLIGQAFQLADDILDVTSDAKTMGKQTAKDAEKGKGTLVSLYGIDESHKRATALLQQAIDTLTPFGDRADILTSAARFILDRKS